MKIKHKVSLNLFLGKPFIFSEKPTEDFSVI